MQEHVLEPGVGRTVIIQSIPIAETCTIVPVPAYFGEIVGEM